MTGYRNFEHGEAVSVGMCMAADLAVSEELISREEYPAPKVRLNPEVKEITQFHYEDFQLVNYHAHPHIKADVAV